MKLIPRSLGSIGAVWIAAMGLGGCTDSQVTTDSSPSPAPKAQTDSALIASVLETNAAIAHAVYLESVATARELQLAINRLVEAPSSANLDAAKAAWLNAREPYGKSEVFRFRGGPIDALKADGSLGEDGNGPEGRINAWPLGEALIDYVVAPVDGLAGPEISNSTRGIQGNIIADAARVPSIDQEVLKANQELGGDERNVTTGYHAIEFLLWGQDVNADGSGIGARDASPGQRPWTDYSRVSGECTSGQISSPESICQRRGEYLQAAANLLVQDLASVAEAWDPTNPRSFYHTYTEGGQRSLAGILQSMGRLSFGELAGERMNIALLDDSQEDEHSCFSDNTHRDIYLNFEGILDSFEGEYDRLDGSTVSGPGIDDLLIGIGRADLEKRLRGALISTREKVGQIDATARKGTPFDQQIQMEEHRTVIAAAISALAEQTRVIEEVARTLQLEVDDLRQDTEQQIR